MENASARPRIRDKRSEKKNSASRVPAIASGRYSRGPQMCPGVRLSQKFRENRLIRRGVRENGSGPELVGEIKKFFLETKTRSPGTIARARGAKPFVGPVPTGVPPRNNGGLSNLRKKIRLQIKEYALTSAASACGNARRKKNFRRKPVRN